MSEIESPRNTVQAQNGIISRLKHELQSIEYALSDVRINNTMTAADVAHEMRCELDTLRAELNVLKAQRDAWKSAAEDQYGKLHAALYGESDYPVEGALDAWARGRYNALRIECSPEGKNEHLEALAPSVPDLLEALQYAIKQVPELATVPGIAAAITKAAPKPGERDDPR